MAADKTEVTEKLPAPELEKITYTPAKTSIAFAWEGVKGATSYEASVAQQTRPDFRKTVETEDSNCEFADLEPGLYIFTVRALYAGNAEFNSDPTQKVVGTLGFAAEKLATPTELAAADVTSSGAKISWAEVNGAANYPGRGQNDVRWAGGCLDDRRRHQLYGCRAQGRYGLYGFGSGARRRRLRGE